MPPKPTSHAKTGRETARRLYPDPLGPCEDCGSAPATHRHHVNGDTHDNRRANLRFLCPRCHMTGDGRLASFTETGRRSLAAIAAARRARTHCRAGHEYTPVNTALRADGVRLCLTCRREIKARSYRRLRDLARP
jgi:hypothetical protein